MAPKLSALILAQNVASFLPRVLANVRAVADEIVVVDGGSTDGTPELVRREAKGRVVSRAFDGDFAAQRNFGLDACTGDWIISVDSDELLSDPLRARIPGLIRACRKRWYKLPRYWLASDTRPYRYVKSELLYPDHQLRLFKNDAAFRYAADKPVHEHFPKEGRGPGKRMREGHIFHFAFALLDRRAREEKIARYEAKLGAGASETNRMYLYEDHAHEIVPCAEALTERDSA